MVNKIKLKKINKSHNMNTWANKITNVSTIRLQLFLMKILELQLLFVIL
jgi:hypothetical protein